MRSRLTIAALLACVALAGCEQVEEVQANRPRPLPPEAYNPTTQVRKVVLTGEIAATDSDYDGVPDLVRVDCFLFPSISDGSVSVVGKGTFRFEVYDARDPAAIRVPLSQINYNFEQSLKYGMSIWGMPAYRFPLFVRNMPPSVTDIFIKGRFFPEGMTADDPDAEPAPGGIPVRISSSVAAAIKPSPVTTTPPTSMPDDGPKATWIRLKPPGKE